MLAGLNASYPDIAQLFGDMACQGLGCWLDDNLGWQLMIVKRPSRWVWVGPGQEPPELPSSSTVLAKCWVVERTFSWT